MLTAVEDLIFSLNRRFIYSGRLAGRGVQSAATAWHHASRGPRLEARDIRLTAPANAQRDLASGPVH